MGIVWASFGASFKPNRFLVQDGQFDLICTAANELGVGWASVWVSVWALLMSDSAMNSLDLMCVLMASGDIVFSPSLSVCNGLGLQNKLRDLPLHNEKARGFYFSARRALSELRLDNRKF